MKSGMAIRLEHANLCVCDLEGVIRFLQTAFPEFKIRRDVRDDDGKRWVHIGTDAMYVALHQATSGEAATRIPYSSEPGLNHLAFEVDDVDAIRARLAAAGYKDSTVPNSHPWRK